MKDMSFFKGKTVVITGATGLIGSNVVDQLMTVSNIRIIVIGRSLVQIKRIFTSYNDRDSFIPIEHNITESFPILDYEVDIILHAAGPISGSIIRETPVSVIRPNIFGLFNCLEFVRKQINDKGKNCRLVVFSSATVYSIPEFNEISVSEENTNIAEYLDSVTAPYSESKRMCEVIARAYQHQYNLDIIIARFAYVYGFSRKMPDTAFYEFVKKSLNGENLLLNSTSAPRRDNIYVDDAISGLLCICEKGVAGETYNISSGGDLGNFAAIDEIAAIIANAASNNISGASVTVSFREHSEEKKPGIILDNTKLKALGWGVEFSLEEGVNKTMISYIASKL